MRWKALEMGLWDIASFNLGKRPLLNERTVIQLVLNRFGPLWSGAWLYEVAPRMEGVV